MNEQEQQFERIYKETENFERTQFVREIQMQINDNKRKDKEIERLKNILDKLGLLDKDIDKETKIVNMTVTLPKWLKDIGKKNKINFSKLLQESLYEVLQIGSDKE